MKSHVLGSIRPLMNYNSLVDFKLIIIIFTLLKPFFFPNVAIDVRFSSSIEASLGTFKPSP